MTSPNARQQQLIDGIGGTYLVDAGPGTGKTFTITRRYANILEGTTVEPEDILLVTFTRNAAGEMRDRIGQQTDYDITELQDAPINTFHGYCYRLLRRYGHTVPEHLSIDERIPQSLDLIEDEVQERAHFRTFASQFEDRHPEHSDIMATLSDLTSLRSLVGELTAKGIVPTADGWYRDTDDLLRGDRDAFLAAFREANEPVEGANGLNQSDARNGITSALDSDMASYAPDAPAYDDIVDYPQVNEGPVLEAFDEDREALLAFVHDLYFEYIEFALGRNFLTQGLMLGLAFVMLAEEEWVRREVRHDYVMIDEFQDTNELQFKLALLLAGTENICVVGDWKQSIYGFQYTSVENITQFRTRVQRYRNDLNSDRERVPFEIDGDAIERIPLKKNYRSTQSVIEFAESALTIPASNSEEIDEAAVESKITRLDSMSHVDNSRIEAVTHEEEIELVLDRIQHIVGNEDYAVEKHDEPQVDEDASAEEKRTAEEARLGTPSYGDIAVFSRVHSFARDLIDKAQEYGIPVAYEGGVELFDTDQAKLLLAWLRIVESDEDRGWTTVLEEAGYTLPDAKRRLEAEDYPDEMVGFRDELREVETMGGLAQRVFDRYGYDGAYADTLVDELVSLYGGSVYSRGEAIEFLERNLRVGTTADIDMNPGTDAVTLQTAHGAKGLEYPIVIMANVNQGAFPHYGKPTSTRVRYDDTLGLRQTQTLADAGTGEFVFDRWQYDVLSGAQPSNYDEERRLYYVAMSRAKRHLVFTAGDNPGSFFTELDCEPVEVEPSVSTQEPESDVSSPLSVSVPDDDLAIRTGVHDIMDDSVYEAVTEGKGKEFGQAVHDFAEAYALGEDVEPADPGADEQRQIATFIDTLDGELFPEHTVLCPLDGSPRIVLTGIIDLLHVGSDRVDIIDYKTDRERHTHEEYRKQLSVYHHVLSSEYPDREIQAIIYYTADDEQAVVDPVPVDELRGIAEIQLTTGK